MIQFNRLSVLVLVILVGFSACSPRPTDDPHKNQLMGSYIGTLPCADCAGIQYLIKMDSESVYHLSTRYLGKEDSSLHKSIGRVSWNQDSTIVQFKSDSSSTFTCLIQPNGLLWLDRAGNKISGDLADRYFLKKLKYTLEDFEALVGLWEIDGEDKFEVWSIDNENSLVGKSYKLEDGKEQHLESLRISWTQDQVLYEATVPDQNNGKTISFEMNPFDTLAFSFENKTHDFPNIIRYTPENDTVMQVEVLDYAGEGFSFRMSKQNL